MIAIILTAIIYVGILCFCFYKAGWEDGVKSNQVK